MEVVIISRWDHFLTYSKMVKEKKISKKNKLVIISSNHNIDKKLGKLYKRKILHITGEQILPLCKNPLMVIKRLKIINKEISKAIEKILSVNPKKIFGITDYFYSITLLSIFEKKGVPIELIENGPSTYEHESINGTKGIRSLRIFYLNLIIKLSKHLRNIKSVDYVYEILFKINNDNFTPRFLNTSFKIKCDHKEFIPLLIKEDNVRNKTDIRISKEKNIFFFNQPFYSLKICSERDYARFIIETFNLFPHNKIYFIPHPSDKQEFIKTIERISQENLIIKNNNNKFITNEELYLNQKNCIFATINSSILMYGNVDGSSSILFLNKLFLDYFENANYLFSFFNDFCLENNFINPTKKELKNFL